MFHSVIFNKIRQGLDKYFGKLYFLTGGINHNTLWILKNAYNLLTALTVQYYPHKANLIILENHDLKPIIPGAI